MCAEKLCAHKRCCCFALPSRTASWNGKISDSQNGIVESDTFVFYIDLVIQLKR